MENEIMENEIIENELVETEEFEEFEEGNSDDNCDNNKVMIALAGISLVMGIGAIARVAVEENKGKLKDLRYKIICRKAEKLQNKAEKLQNKAVELYEESKIVEVEKTE